ncbi:hypothetical protein [Sphingobacterium kyonggiense]
MNHEEILKETKAQIDALVIQAKEKLDGLGDPKELEVGKWYKRAGQSMFVVTGSNRACNIGYGFDRDGVWFDDGGELYTDNYIESTPQEVEEALIKEAKRRGLVESGVRFRSPDGTDYGYFYNGGKVYYNSNPKRLVFKEDESTGIHLFFNGKWATIIEQPADKFAELKEAHKSGAVIQCLSAFDTWEDCTPAWREDHQYRIKPEEKPKVGDVCKFWDNDENEYYVGKLAEIDDSPVPYHSNYDVWHQHALPLTQQEVINLLFTK